MKNENREEFLQGKYEYYRTYHTWVVILSALASVTFWVSDCQIFGRLAWETLLPRTFILLPLVLFVLASRKTNNYKIMIPFAYVILHGIMWCTIWAIVYLPDKQYAREGFIIMHLMFFAVGFCASFKTSTLAHSLVIVNIIVSNTFNHYESFALMLSLAIPCVIAICGVLRVMEQVYMDLHKAMKSLETTVVLDPLTKVYNRHKLSEMTTRDTANAYLEDMLNAVMMVDVDHFKKVNDTYGHEAGDKVLVYVANQIRSQIRENDAIIRWGGEEFVVIMKNCLPGIAKRRAESIRVAVEENKNEVCPITVSIGVGMFSGTNYKKAILEADKAMYDAKQKGRNQVVMWELQ